MLIMLVNPMWIPGVHRPRGPQRTRAGQGLATTVVGCHAQRNPFRARAVVHLAPQVLANIGWGYVGGVSAWPALYVQGHCRRPHSMLLDMQQGT